MAATENDFEIEQEDAFHIIVQCLREGRKSSYSSYGYELYLPNVVRDYLETVKKILHHDTDRHLPKLSPSFYAAAWELCRIGILRPGIKAYGEQATPDGSSGNGYTVTPLGREWLQEQVNTNMSLSILVASLGSWIISRLDLDQGSKRDAKTPFAVTMPRLT